MSNQEIEIQEKTTAKFVKNKHLNFTQKRVDLVINKLHTVTNIRLVPTKNGKSMV